MANEKYGGSKNDHLILNKQKDNRLCRELKKENTTNTSEKNDDQSKQGSQSSTESSGRFQVEIKTGHTGFLGLGGGGTDAPVFVRIYDSNDRQSEAFQLKHSTKHRNKFERNQTDHFILHTEEPLGDVSQVDLWHEGDKNDGWQVDYINITDNQTNTSYCFPVNSMLDQNSGLRQKNIHLEDPSINVPCKELTEAIKKTSNYTSASKRLKSDKSARNYTVRTKTGNHPSAGSTTPIHLQLTDVHDKKSKDIRLKKKDMEGHHFAPGTIDEFKITLPEPLSTLKAVKLSLDADKYQGWYGVWISITDDENQKTYCFPIQRWLDKGESDHKTHVTLYRQSNVPCEQLSDSMLNLSSTADNEGNVKNSMVNPLSSGLRSEQNAPHEFQIRTQTADKSLQGKAGRDANVYLNIYDKTNKQIGGSIPLENSKNHKIPFQRHHTDKFDITIPNVKMYDVDRIDLYHDGQNDGWFCDFVELKNPQTNEIKCFSVHQWLDELSDKVRFSMTNYQTTSCDDKQHGKTLSTYQYYTIRIKTNATNLSANNSINTFLKLFGKSHQTEQIPLDRTIDNKQAFQRNNSIDIFEIRTLIKLNSLEKIEFYYEFQSTNGKLSLEWIEITNLSNGIISCFPVNRTLTQSDKRLQQILTLTESNNKPCSF